MVYPIMHRNIGKVVIPSRWYEDRELMVKIFSEFIPFEARYEAWTDRIVCVGISERFEEVDSSCLPPEYEIDATRRKGEVVISFIKIEFGKLSTREINEYSIT